MLTSGDCIKMKIDVKIITVLKSLRVRHLIGYSFEHLVPEKSLELFGNPHFEYHYVNKNKKHPTMGCL